MTARSLRAEPWRPGLGDRPEVFGAYAGQLAASTYAPDDVAAAPEALHRTLLAQPLVMSRGLAVASKRVCVGGADRSVLGWRAGLEEGGRALFLPG